MRPGAATWAEFWRVAVLSAEAWLSVCGDWNPEELAEARRDLSRAKRMAARWKKKAEAEAAEVERALFERLLPSSAP